MTTASNRLKKIIIEAVVIHADGSKEDLGKVCEIVKPKRGILSRIKVFSKQRGE